MKRTDRDAKQIVTLTLNDLKRVVGGTVSKVETFAIKQKVSENPSGE
jgi:hypothetical protein